MKFITLSPGCAWASPCQEYDPNATRSLLPRKSRYCFSRFFNFRCMTAPGTCPTAFSRNPGEAAIPAGADCRDVNFDNDLHRAE